MSLGPCGSCGRSSYQLTGACLAYPSTCIGFQQQQTDLWRNRLPEVPAILREIADDLRPHSRYVLTVKLLDLAAGDVERATVAGTGMASAASALLAKVWPVKKFRGEQSVYELDRAVKRWEGKR